MNDMNGAIWSIVANYIDNYMRQLGQTTPDFSMSIDWFMENRHGWRAMVHTSLPDGMHYEIEYFADINQGYLTTYRMVNTETFSMNMPVEEPEADKEDISDEDSDEDMGEQETDLDPEGED